MPRGGLAAAQPPDENHRRWLAGLEDLAALAERQKRNAVFEQNAASPRLNFFSALGVSRREVKTHSNLLCLLLDPHREHGQGNLFLRRFLEINGIRDAIGEVKQEHDPHWAVHQELASRYGRIDVVLENPKADVVIVIENKIDARDQKGQLWRYQQWLDGRPERRKALCYLTIAGDEPSDLALFRAGRRKDDVLNGLVRLSHRQDISALLLHCRDRVNAPDVRALIRHYLDLVRSL